MAGSLSVFAIDCFQMLKRIIAHIIFIGTLVPKIKGPEEAHVLHSSQIVGYVKGGFFFS